CFIFFFSSRRRHTRSKRDWSSDVCSSDPMRHIDEVILPHTLRVDYWIGDHAHVVTILVATPEDDYRTRVYTRMGVRYGWLTPLRSEERRVAKECGCVGGTGAGNKEKWNAG